MTFTTKLAEERETQGASPVEGLAGRWWGLGGGGGWRGEGRRKCPCLRQEAMAKRGVGTPAKGLFYNAQLVALALGIERDGGKGALRNCNRASSVAAGGPATPYTRTNTNE